MTPRTPTLADVAHIASIHLQCWQETYTGLISYAEIARRDLDYRKALWSKMIASRTSHIRLIDDVGFAQVGGQRDRTLAVDYPRELYALYILKAAHGSGAAQILLADVLTLGTGGFSTLVLKGNNRAIAFYKKSGGTYLKDVTDTLGYTDLAFGWSVPIQLHR